MKVRELIALLAECDPELEVAAGYPIVAQPTGKDHQESACYVVGVDQANLSHETEFGNRFALIQIRPINDVWLA
jgi:hypothetical protein